MAKERSGRWRWAGVAVAALLLAACGGDSSPSDDAQAQSPATEQEADGEATSGPSGVLQLAAATALQTFDPALVQNPQLYYLQPLYDTLLRIDADDQVQPGIAEEWEYDGVTATLHLREEATFHDGTPIDAEAVKANLERFLEKQGPQIAGVADLSSITVVDAQTVELGLSTPSPTLLIDLAQAPGMMMNPSAFEDPNLATKPAGTSGPYAFDPASSPAGDHWVYAPAEGYWDPSQQRVERMELLAITDNAARTNALQAGEVNVAAVSFGDVERFEAMGFKRFSDPISLYYVMVLDREGTKEPAMADVRVRRALALALDREAILEGIFAGHGTATTQAYLEGELGYSPELEGVHEYDPEAARALLAEAGYGDGLDLVMVTQPATKSWGEAVIAFWAEVGIDVTLDEVPGGAQAEAGRTGNYSIFPGPTTVGDPKNWYDRFWGPAAPYNAAWGLSDEHLDDLAQQGAALVDDEARRPIYAEMMEHMVGEAYFIPMARVDSVMMTTEEVDGITWAPLEFGPNPVNITVG